MLEFDLFSDPSPNPSKKDKSPWSVSHLNKVANLCLSSSIGSVWVTGEVSNLKRYHNGHSYFSLKDASSQISCTMFNGTKGSAVLKDGAQIEIRGDVGIYQARGQFQIIVRSAEVRGDGALEARLRALQESLRAEGLFDQSRKRPLPANPTRIGVVTSPIGAAIRDFIHILNRRAPHIEIFIAPVRVQGRGAANEIAEAVSAFSDPLLSGFPAVDAIVVTRGGGSLEDLWEFNEEILARAIAASQIPVISAVGHEIDFTTSDLVADFRAPTPSAAAEILSSDRKEIFRRLAYLSERLRREASSRIELAREQFKRLALSHGFRSPLQRVENARQFLDDALSRSSSYLNHKLHAHRESLRHARAILQARSPSSSLALLRDQVASLQARQLLAVTSALQRRQNSHTRLSHALRILSPQQTLERGFTITMSADRHPITSINSARSLPEIITRFADGELTSHPAP